MKAIAYVRVSTIEQSYETQIEQIKRYAEFRGVELLKLFSDKASGKSADRKGYQDLLAAIKSNTIGANAVIVCKLDRVGRNLRELLSFVDLCRENKIDFISIGNNVDTSTSEGRLFLSMMGAVGEYERELTLERTAVGRKAYIAKGGKMGRDKIKLPMDEVARLYNEKVPVTEISRRFRVSTPTIYQALRELGYQFASCVKKHSKTKPLSPSNTTCNR